jgi:hypothetical protein
MDPGQVSSACRDHERMPSSLDVIDIFGMVLLSKDVKVGKRAHCQQEADKHGGGDVFHDLSLSGLVRVRQ